MRGVLLGLTAGQKLGLALVAALVIVFSLASALLVPRTHPGFPGRRGLPVFVVVTVALFVAMLGAVEVFAREHQEGPERERTSEAGITSSEDENEEVLGGENRPPGTTSPGRPARTIRVSGTEFKFKLSNANLSPGTYRFELKNDGQVVHNLVIEGPGVDKTSTPVIESGETSSLTVALVSGTYTFYCSVPGHEDAGMKVEVDVS